MNDVKKINPEQLTSDLNTFKSAMDAHGGAIVAEATATVFTSLLPMSFGEADMQSAPQVNQTLSSFIPVIQKAFETAGESHNNIETQVKVIKEVDEKNAKANKVAAENKGETN